MTDKKILGAKGENLAAKFLEQKGYKIIDRNYQAKNFGEIDIIAEQEGQIIFIEVKTKTQYQFGLPEEALTKVKKNKLNRAINFYLNQRHYPIDFTGWRLELVAIDLFPNQLPKIYHYDDLS
jgi:putative endonuclease